MNLFELFVKIGVDDQASNKLSIVTDKLGNGLKTAAKVGTAAVAVASAGIVALTSSAVKSYAEYEQLVGGVETLFKDSADIVKGYAAEAYQTAGMSANQYMENTTSFAAALLGSLDGDTTAAAEHANRAMISMSDNANKMGTDIDSIVATYQSLSRGNMAMLDNLKLGYGGTKAELERLIADAASYTDIQKEMGVTVDASSMSFDNIVNAIAVVQGHLGIAGATALEASTTIEGSVNAMKAAWTNLVVGVADDNADFQTLIDNFVSSTGTALDNILPRVEIAIGGVSDLIENLFPVIMDRIPQIIAENLPKIASAGVAIIESLVTGIGNNLPLIVSSTIKIVNVLINRFIQLLPQIIQLGLDLMVALAEGIADYLPVLIPTIVFVVSEIVKTLTAPKNLGKLINASIILMTAVVEGIMNALPIILSTAPNIISSLAEGIINATWRLWEASKTIVISIGENIVDAAWRLLSSGVNIVKTIVEGIEQGLWRLISKGKEIIDSVKEGIMGKINNATTWGKDLIDNFIGGIKSKWNSLKNTVGQTAQSIKDYLGFSEPEKGPLSNFHTYAPDMMDLFIKGIRDNEKKLTDQIEKTFDFGEKTIQGTIGLTSGMDGFGSSGHSVSVIQNIYSQAKTAADLMQEARYQQEKAVYLGV